MTDTPVNIDKLKEQELPSETEITAHWLDSGPLVSCICKTYNHERYIEDAMRGFLLQKTRFPFEIVIHDDASTDRTRDILQPYLKNYPNIIKPVFQKENYYSQGIAINLLAARYASGEFLAFCEGDDYWIDEHKLQLQIDALNDFPSAEVCFHSAVKTVHDSPDPQLFCKRANGTHLFTVEPIIRNGGSFMPTAAMVLRRSYFERLFQDTSGFYERHLRIFCCQMTSALAGGALYIDRPMCVYRSFAEGSWSEKVYSNPEFYKRWVGNYLNTLNHINAVTDYRYAQDFSVSINRCHLSVLNNALLDLDFRENYFAEHKNELGIWGKLLWLTVLKWPVPHALFKRLRSLLR